MSTFSPIIRVRKFLDRMKAERDYSPRGIKKFPSKSHSGDLESPRQKPKFNYGSGFTLMDSGNYDSMDMTPLVHQFRTFSEHISLKLGASAFSTLPNEAALIIFSFLEANDLFHARLVSKDWRFFADDNLIWKSLCLSDFGLDVMYAHTWKETYRYLEELFSEGLWEGMSKWTEPAGFDNEQKTTARLHFLKRKTRNQTPSRSGSKQWTASPVVLHRVDSSSNATETASTTPSLPTYENSLFKINGSGVTINCASPSPFRIEGERCLSDATLQTFVWNKHFEKHTSVYKGAIDYATRTVSGTIDYHDGITHWKGVFFYTKAKKEKPTSKKSLFA